MKIQSNAQTPNREAVSNTDSSGDNATFSAVQDGIESDETSNYVNSAAMFNQAAILNSSGHQFFGFSEGRGNTGSYPQLAESRSIVGSSELQTSTQQSNTMDGPISVEPVASMVQPDPSKPPYEKNEIIHTPSGNSYIIKDIQEYRPEPLIWEDKDGEQHVLIKFPQYIIDVERVVFQDSGASESYKSDLEFTDNEQQYKITGRLEIDLDSGKVNDGGLYIESGGEFLGGSYINSTTGKAYGGIGSHTEIDDIIKNESLIDDLQFFLNDIKLKNKPPTSPIQPNNNHPDDADIGPGHTHNQGSTGGRGGASGGGSGPTGQEGDLAGGDFGNPIDAGGDDASGGGLPPVPEPTPIVPAV